MKYVYIVKDRGLVLAVFTKLSKAAEYLKNRVGYVVKIKLS